MDEVQGEAYVVRHRAGAVGFRLLFWGLLVGVLYAITFGVAERMAGEQFPAVLTWVGLLPTAMAVAGLLSLLRALPEGGWRWEAILAAAALAVPTVLGVLLSVSGCCATCRGRSWSRWSPPAWSRRPVTSSSRTCC